MTMVPEIVVTSYSEESGSLGNLRRSKTPTPSLSLIFDFEDPHVLATPRKSASATSHFSRTETHSSLPVYFRTQRSASTYMDANTSDQSADSLKTDSSYSTLT